MCIRDRGWDVIRREVIRASAAPERYVSGCLVTWLEVMEDELTFSFTSPFAVEAGWWSHVGDVGLYGLCDGACCGAYTVCRCSL